MEQRDTKAQMPPKSQRYSTVPPLEYYSNPVTPSPLKKKQGKDDKIKSPGQADETDRRRGGVTDA